MRTPSHRGFTLIELLVVVAVLVVLIAILFAALSNAKYEAKFTICKSNLRRVTMAATTFAADSNGRLPYNIITTRSDGGGSTGGYAYPGQREMLYYRNQGNYVIGGVSYPPDNRPKWQPYIPLDTLFCPFAKPFGGSTTPTLASYPPTEVIYSSYEFWVGGEVANPRNDTNHEDGLYTTDKPMLYNGKKYSVLVADLDAFVPSNLYIGSHPDSSGKMSLIDLYPLNSGLGPNRYYGVRWQSTSPRGKIDRNFGYKDGAVISLRKIIAPTSSTHDPRLSRLPYRPTFPTDGQSAFLPPD